MSVNEVNISDLSDNFKDGITRTNMKDMENYLSNTWTSENILNSVIPFKNNFQIRQNSNSMIIL